MGKKGVFWFIFYMIVLTSILHGLKLNRQRPSTIWGFQKQLFNEKQEKDYFKSFDGTYNFKYDTGNSNHQMFRNEKRYSDGTVIGFFGYIDPEGILRITEYVAGRFGYRQRTVLRHQVLNSL